MSRIEVTAYVHGSTELLGVQIDAAINAGNSGGPALTRAASGRLSHFQIAQVPVYSITWPYIRLCIIQVCI